MRVEYYGICQKLHVTCLEHSNDIFLYFLNYINTLVIISSYYEKTYGFVFRYIVVFKHILPFLIDKSAVLVHF